MKAKALSLWLGLGGALLVACGPEGSQALRELQQQQSAIIGGSATTDFVQVAFLYTKFEDDTTSLCSGTLISPRVVVTAAHCVDFTKQVKTYFAFFGSDVTQAVDPAFADQINILEASKHPAYVKPLPDHDIGVVLLERAAPFKPIRYNREPLEGHVGKPLRLVGWGQSSVGAGSGVKRTVETTLARTHPATAVYGSAIANTCNGDSGGPSFMTLGGKQTVIGVTSGTLATQCDGETFATRIDAHASDFVDAFIATKDPSGVCLANGACNSACGEADPDCDAAATPDAGIVKVEGTSAGGATGGNGATEPDESAGCSATQGGLLWAAGLTVLVLSRRRSRETA